MALDNCDIVYLEQDPAPGTVFNYSGVISVTITASDISGNVTSADFDVFMIDTIPPEIIIDSTVSYIGDSFKLLDAFQAVLRPYIDDSTWNNNNLVMISSPEGEHMGGWYDKRYSMITVTPEDLEKLGYETFRVYLK
jgi:hypothetical protein